MSSSVHVRSIQALDNLRVALKRFGVEVQSVLQAANLEVRRTQEFLAARERHWQGEMMRAQAELDRAQRALQVCRSQAVRDPETGQVQVPPCTQEFAAVEAAARHLAAAERELVNVRHWIAQVEQANAEYQREAQRLGRQAASDVPHATALLDGKIASLQAYTNLRGGGGIVGGVAGVVGGALGGVVGALVGGGHSSGSGGGSGTSRGAPAASGGAGGASGSLPSGFKSVPLAQIDTTENYVHSRADFRKASFDDIAEGLHKLDAVVLPAMAHGATSDDFYQMDQEQGLSAAGGYQQVYEEFFGSDPVAVERMGNQYRVLSGFHRIYVARELGMTSIPARMV